MTIEERRKPEILNGKRKKRIAAGSGRSPQEINELLRSFDEMRKMMKQLGGAKGLGGVKKLRALQGVGDGAGMPDLESMMAGGGAGMPRLPGMGGGPGGMAGVGAGAGKPRNKKVPKRKKKKR